MNNAPRQESKAVHERGKKSIVCSPARFPYSIAMDQRVVVFGTMERQMLLFCPKIPSKKQQFSNLVYKRYQTMLKSVVVNVLTNE